MKRSHNQSLPFTRNEYQGRLQKVHNQLDKENLDAILISRPANINWLTGFDAWSFYTPQAMIVEIGSSPIWLGREMDASSAKLSSVLEPEQLVSWPEELVQHPTRHPGDYIGMSLANLGFNKKRIGYEKDSDFLSPRMIEAIKTKLPNTKWFDADLMINWLRFVKTRDEIKYMRQAAQIAGLAMDAAIEGLSIGERQCNIMARVVAAQIKGTPEFGGDMTALHPLILAGENASAAHPLWTDEVIKNQNAVAFELGGCRKRYNVGLARSTYLGKPPKKILDVAKVVQEGMEVVLSAMRPNVEAASVHQAWQSILDRYKLEKKSRIGYSIGLGYSPDWGEHTLSIRSNEKNTLKENSTIHIILGMWMADWGLEISETIHVTSKGAICLTQYPRELIVLD